MYVISCDPGKTGGICIFKDGKLEIATPVPVHTKGHIDVCNIQRMWDVCLLGHLPTATVLENVHAMPTDGRSSVMSFGRTTGNLEAMLRLVSLDRFYQVRPQDWKKHFGLKGKNKEQAIELMEELQPDIWDNDGYHGFPKYFFMPRKKTINKQEKSGVADAYLIGKYYLENNSSTV